MSEKEYRQNYYQKNKQRWAEVYNGQKVMCPVCDAKVSKWNLLRHQRTSKKHQKAMENKEAKDVLEYIIADESNLKEFIEKIAMKMKSLKDKEKMISEQQPE